MATLSNQSLMSSHESNLTVVQRSAFSPGVFGEMERAAGLDPYNEPWRAGQKRQPQVG